MDLKDIYIYKDIAINVLSKIQMNISTYVTRKAKTDLMALAIFDQWSVFNSLLRSHL